MTTIAHDRELNLVRDECTEPVVRENLELQERLAAHEQTKADLEDRLTATRSEVSFFCVFLFLILFGFVCVSVLPPVFRQALVCGVCYHAWAAQYDTWLLIELMLQGVVFAFLFWVTMHHLSRGLADCGSNMTISRRMTVSDKSLYCCCVKCSSGRQTARQCCKQW